MTGCLRPSPADNFPVLAGIQTSELCRKGTLLSPVRRAMGPGHLLHSAQIRSQEVNAVHPKSRHPFVPTARKLISSSDDNNRRGAPGWSPIEWGVVEGNYEIPYYHLRHQYPLSCNGPTKNRVLRLNRLLTGVGRFRSCVHKWYSAACECGVEECMAWKKWDNRMAAQYLPRDLVQPSKDLLSCYLFQLPWFWNLLSLSFSTLKWQLMPFFQW